MVRAMTMSQQYKIDVLFRKKTMAEWKSAAITENNNMLRTFKDDFISILGSKSLMKADAYNTFTVKGSSNSVSVSAGAGAKAGLYKISVEQMATGAKAVGGRFASEGNTLGSLNATLRTLIDSDARATSDFGDINTVHLTDRNDEYMYDDEGEAVMGFKFSINGVDFQFKETDRLSDVLNTINSSKAGVKLSYTQLSNRFTLESTATGSSSRLNVVEDESDFFAFLGLAGSSDAEATSVFDPQEGQNAVVYINGYKYQNASNSFTVDGMSFTLNGVTSDFEFTIERDTSKSFDLVKSFVDSLNEMLTKIGSDLRQKKDGKYSPLTDMMKESMSEKEIEDWEKKAKEGMFYRDNKLDTLLRSLQKELADSGLRDIGISFGTYTPGSVAKLEINEDKLRAALESDPDKVYNIMARAANPSERDTGGVLHRVGAAIDKYTADTRTYDIQNLRDNVNDYVKRINEQEDKLYIMQERLYLKYAAFEKSLASMQSQSGQISAYFG
ncbi:MAG: flagellar filament capping protein FliD [Oscillospiraceae bacterium]|nr:flagellar filament capping protein FliD [Oscillospiraceae bacterium]